MPMAQREFSSTTSGKRNRLSAEDIEAGSPLPHSLQYKEHVSDRTFLSSTSANKPPNPAPSTSSSSPSSSTATHTPHSASSQVYSQTMKVLAATFYGVSSILVIFSNKAVMTNFHFHYFDVLATLQFIVTSSILVVLMLLKKIEIPPLSLSICREILPVSLMFLGNVLCGLGSTKSLNIPMFTALRRFSIFLTMMGEWALLKTKPSSPIVLSVAMMVGGSFIAAMYDLSFDLHGYSLVFLNNIFTALNGVYMKKAAVSGKCTKTGVLFYNSLFSAVIMVAYFLAEHFYLHSFSAPSGTAEINLVAMPNELPMSTKEVTDQLVAAGQSTLDKVWAFDGWNNPSFLFMFFGAASMGSVLNYSIFLCTTVNSPLTTAVVGATKNVATTYIGMLVFSDYTFSWVNFLGINVSILGSLYYTYMILFKGASGFGGA